MNLKKIKNDLYNCRWAIMILVVYALLTDFYFEKFCPAVILTGFPCPACGMTRSTLALLTGDLKAFFYWNPLSLLWIIFFLWFFYLRYGKNCTDVDKRVFFVLIGLGFLTVVYFLYRLSLGFPGEGPIVYYENNILKRLL